MALFFIGLAIACALMASGVSLLADRYPVLLRYVSFSLLGCAGVSATLSGGIVVAENLTLTTQLPLGLPWLAWHVRLDPLSGFFCMIIGIITASISLYAPGYVREFLHGQYSLAVLGLFTGLFIAGMLLVLIADDAFFFMIAWEIMSVASYFLVAYQHLQSANRRAAFLYLLMAHIGALFILIALSLFAYLGGNASFDAMRAVSLSTTWGSVLFFLALIGFGMKAGLVPLHAWLPEAHPVAPSHISALMSGVMLKVAIYGLIRVSVDLIDKPHWTWGVVLLSIGAISAVLGILYALMQNDVKRLLAYSSIENIGIICIALGLSLLFTAVGRPLIGSLALLAALYHALNHAVFKSLLFLGAGAILHTTHEKDLERMGGLLKRLPYTGFFFLIGVLSISALPPFNGFVSEWLLFQAALQAPSLESGVLRALIPLSAALLALTSALSVACFVKLYGIAFLGQPRTRHVKHARETSWGMKVGQGFLAVLCLLLGIFPTNMINFLDTIPQTLLGVGLPSASAEGWLWLTPIASHVASYSAPLVVLSIMGVWGLVYLFLRGRKQTRYTHPWDCGFSEPSARMQYTSTAFAMPMRRIFKPLWRIDESVEDTKNSTLQSTAIRYQLALTDHSWYVLYEPIGRAVLWIARLVSRLQTGNIRVYLTYSFFTLIILLWVIT
ncbi:formate hydrogenlyase subunit 3/multisubunit Na+/H+ antiporter, MnhD subunit [Beggiatoa alba B18LD]|uniref:Formate hydrogenlyase subunit 3/multisubunit Na+/H+ antiporter, MnhD subunit n=1 Tax=Beggiatoa alba B18LD TaxID=395493 RepID=I3CHB4_9GAMM|nr:hydrogenase 4 subunit B [Beggiatoa alba]EIJ43007.1 formate hydrogenlyase subunit 3/multisubunit Na+/H+ antiporter, MnhD subunit [Beggiatoa alba B18LD]